MKCDDIRERFIDFIDGTIDEKGKQAVEQHIMECDSCYSELNTLKRISSRLRDFPEEEPSPEVGTRFYSMLGVYSHGRNGAREKAQSGVKISELLLSLWPKYPVLQAAFVLVFITASFFMGRLSVQEKPSNGELANLRAEMTEMRELLTISLLNQSSAIDRLRGVSMSRDITDPDEQFLTALIKRLNTDSDVNVRIAAVNALGRYSGREWVRTELVSSLSRQISPNVQVALIDLLATVKEKQAVDVFQQLIGDQYSLEPVKKRARLAIEKII